MGDEIVEMPAQGIIRRAAAESDLEAIVRVMETSAIEVWFSIPPDELRGILNAVPSEMFDDEGFGFVFRTLLNPDTARETAPRGQAAAMVSALEARLRGFPATAATIMDDVFPEDVVQSLFDQRGALAALTRLHRGFTNMLAGRLPEARAGLAAATVTPPPRALTMLLRDAYAKSAVLCALFGSHSEARRHLDIAASLPRSVSWAEPAVTAHLDIAEALLAPDDHLDAEIARIERLPAFVVGETWPYWLLAVFTLYVRARRAAEGVIRVELLSAGTPAATAGDGLASSALPLIRATAAMIAGDGAAVREALAQADPEVTPVKLLSAATAVPRDGAEGVTATLVGLRAETEGFEQLDALRVLILAWATLHAGDEARAESLLRDLMSRRGPYASPLLLVPVELEEFARDRIEGWSAPRSVLTQRLSEPHTLSKRERAVLGLLASDRTRDQIAEELFVSVNTIKSQLSSIFRKLGVNNRLDAVLEAERRSLI